MEPGYEERLSHALMKGMVTDELYTPAHKRPLPGEKTIFWNSPSRSRESETPTPLEKRNPSRRSPGGLFVRQSVEVEERYSASQSPRSHVSGLPSVEEFLPEQQTQNQKAPDTFEEFMRQDPRRSSVTPQRQVQSPSVSRRSVPVSPSLQTGRNLSVPPTPSVTSVPPIPTGSPASNQPVTPQQNQRTASGFQHRSVTPGQVRETPSRPSRSPFTPEPQRLPSVPRKTTPASSLSQPGKQSSMSPAPAASPTPAAPPASPAPPASTEATNMGNWQAVNRGRGQRGRGGRHSDRPVIPGERQSERVRNRQGKKE